MTSGGGPRHHSDEGFFVMARSGAPRDDYTGAPCKEQERGSEKGGPESPKGGPEE